MKLTIEQQQQMRDADAAHHKAMNGAIVASCRALMQVCNSCWYGQHRQCGFCTTEKQTLVANKNCFIWRMHDTVYKCSGLSSRGKLGVNCWQLAKDATDISEVPFIG